MYDSATADLIRNAPSLGDLNRDALPDRFTEAFARIAAVRVRLRAAEGELPESLGKTRHFTRRLAQTNEALVALSPGREDRRSAAFVAATAYQLVYQIEALSGATGLSTHLTATEITADVSSMLLFLVAEYSADATEVSQRIILSDAELERELLRTLIELAQGHVSRTVQRSLLDAEQTVRSATDALYHLILRGVRCLASVLVGQPTADDPSAILRQAQALAGQPDNGLSRSDDLGSPYDMLAQSPVALFPGPYHLASLLLAVVDTLTEAAIVKVPPPDDVDPMQWQRLMSTLAEKRPYLWPNHQEAISKGYLQTGVSSVIGFPTGAGKSAVSQLKIGAVLLAHRRVVFLAPTHALVDQTRRDLKRVFPDAKVRGERQEDFAFAAGEGLSADILIMTPESCLVRQHTQPHAFDDVGLLVFDECHLVHPRTKTDRRAIDAMLCIINVVRLVPNADLLLLSAMMKNTDEVAEWITDLTARDALDFAMTWKPTRQLRGCVVYERERINELNAKLRQSRRESRTSSAPVAVKRQLAAKPHGFFSIKQTWSSTNRSDYAYLPFCEDSPVLGVNAQWQLTPNAGAVAAALAAPAATAGINTLIFSQSIRMAGAIAKRVAESLGRREIELQSDEKRWVTVAVDELGGTEQLYIDIRDEMLVVRAAAHHGLLLPEERQLIESLYARPDGLAVLSATSTLGQGMNLPSELVIIAEDSRFDEQLGRRELLEARELLNAAGRAGRAGQKATGVVVVIPGRVVAFDDRESTIGTGWTKLREIFGQTDQCLVIDDPLTAVLDHIHDQARQPNDLERYVVSRLCGVVGQEDGSVGDREAIRRTLGAFRKRRGGDAAWVEDRTEAALALLAELDVDDDAAEAVRRLSASLGLPEDVLLALRVDVLDAAPSRYDPVAEWRAWMFEWMLSHPKQTVRMFRSEDLDQQFGSSFKHLQDDEARVLCALPRLERALGLWMDGKPLTDIQPVLSDSTAAAEIGKSMSARKFVVRLLPALAHAFSALPRIIGEGTNAGENLQETAPTVFFLARCVRFGFSSLEMYALYEHVQASSPSRREIHRKFEAISAYVPPAPGEESWPDVKKRVATAWNAQNRQ